MEHRAPGRTTARRIDNQADHQRVRSSDEARGHDPDDGFGAVRAAYPPMLNTAQVAELLDLNPRTVLNMAADGRLPASRLAGSRKFHFLLEEVIMTLKASRVVPTTGPAEAAGAEAPDQATR